MATDVDLTVEDGIAWLTLRRPETRNAVEAEFMEAAIDALDKLPDGVGALVLAGEGPAFCVGVDLHMTRDAISNGQVEEKLHRLLTAMHTITRKLRALPVPTVAAVEGAAAGAGAGLACACDLRVVGASFDEHLDAEEATIRPMLTTADVAEGVAAFLERRRPNFQGA